MIFRTTAVLAALLLGACSASEEPTPAQTDAGANNAATATDSSSATLWNGGQAMPLDIQVAHANGVVLQLTSLQSRATDTSVGIRVINGREREIDLNRFPNNRNGYLVLDSGERLYLSPPVSNRQLTVPAGQTFEGELVFLGRLPTTNSATLILNESYSGDNEHTSSPAFRIDLPVAGTPR